MSSSKHVASKVAFFLVAVAPGITAVMTGCDRSPAPPVEQPAAVVAVAPAEGAAVKRDPLLSKFSVRLLAFHEELVSVVNWASRSADRVQYCPISANPASLGCRR